MNEETKTLVIKRAKSITLDLKEYQDIVDLGHRLGRFAKLIYDNREGLTAKMVEEFYKANGLDHER